MGKCSGAQVTLKPHKKALNFYRNIKRGITQIFMYLHVPGTWGTCTYMYVHVPGTWRYMYVHVRNFTFFFLVHKTHEKGTNCHVPFWEVLCTKYNLQKKRYMKKTWYMYVHVSPISQPSTKNFLLTLVKHNFSFRIKKSL